MVQETSDPENPAVSSEDPKNLARTLIREGVDPAEVVERTGLSLSTVNGLKGVLRKTLKRAQGEAGATGDKARVEKQGDGIPTESDFLRQILQDVKFSKIDAVVSLVDSYGFNVQGIYAGLKDVGAALSIVRYVVKRWASYHSEDVPGWILREIEGTTSMVRPHVNDGDGQAGPLTREELEKIFDQKLKEQRDQDWKSWVNSKLENNDGGQVSKLEARLEEMRKEFRDKQLEDIKSEVESLRRNASAPDSLTQVVKSVENLLSEGLSHPGPIRLYLTPDGINIQKKSDAPALLRAQPAEDNVLEELKRHGLVTRIVDVQKGGA